MVPDITNDPAEWKRIHSRKGLWQNRIYLDAFSRDGGLTFTISTERESAEIPRLVRKSRNVRA